MIGDGLERKRLACNFNEARNLGWASETLALQSLALTLCRRTPNYNFELQ